MLKTQILPLVLTRLPKKDCNFVSTLLSGFQAHSSLGSSISTPTLVRLDGWQEEEEEENEDDQEINSGSTPKQGTGSSC